MSFLMGIPPELSNTIRSLNKENPKYWKFRRRFVKQEGDFLDTAVSSIKMYQEGTEIYTLDDCSVSSEMTNTTSISD